MPCVGQSYVTGAGFRGNEDKKLGRVIWRRHEGPRALSRRVEDVLEGKGTIGQGQALEWIQRLR